MLQIYFQNHKTSAPQISQHYTTVTSFDKHLVNEHKTNMKRANSNSDFGLCCQ